MITVQVATDDKVPSVRDIRRWATKAVEREEQKLCIRIMDELEAKRLNQQFRNQAKATNVLAFPTEDAEWLGDIAICSQVTASEAELSGTPLEEHYAHLVIHGVLHLQGYDHTTPQEAQTMQAKEVELLTSLGIANPYQ